MRTQQDEDLELAKTVKFGGSICAEYNNQKESVELVHKDCVLVKAVPYDIPIQGYCNQVVNTLRLWKAEPVNDLGNLTALGEQISISNITGNFYPDDHLYLEKELRMKQQYFLVSASVQDGIWKYKRRHHDIRRLPEKVAFQLNETHTAMVVLELMRILMDEECLTWDESWEITTKTCTFTIHTNSKRELEKWPVEIFSKIFPRLYMILEEINRRFQIEFNRKYPNDYERFQFLSLISEGQVRMANLSAVACQLKHP